MRIIRNDACVAADIIAKKPQGVIISPGPGSPEHAGMNIELVSLCYDTGLPVLGVCLGHQAVACAFGGSVRRISPPVHGKISNVVRTQSNDVTSDIFAFCPDKFPVTRYHSLVVDERNLPDDLTVTARTEAGAIMGLSHGHAEIHGVQFHPESIASVAGYRILAQFLVICGQQIVSGEKLGQLESQILRLDQRFPGQMHI